MKHLPRLTLVLILLAMLAGCGASEPAETLPAAQPTETTILETEPEVRPITCEPAAALDYSAVMEELSEKRKAQLEAAADWSGLQNYVGEDKKLVTAEEWRILTNPGDRNEVVTYEEAVADIDLLFRVYEEAYSGYYYFGAEPFRQAKEEILSWLEGQQTVVSPELHQVYIDAMQFLQDCHADLVKLDSEEYQTLCYGYFYAEGWEFSKDEHGFYAVDDGIKWYVDGFSQELAAIEYKLCSDGRIVYAPVLFCPLSEAKPCDITLQNENGDVVTQEITWTKGGQPLFNTPDIQRWEENGIVYLSVRSFGSSQYGTELQRDFVDTGKELQNAKLVILDLRGNLGGNSWFGSEWIHKLTGKWAMPRYAAVYRGKALADIAFPGMSPSENVVTDDGEFMENDIPIVLLVDNQVASSGEMLMEKLCTMENVMTIGSNTMGCYTFGNIVGLQLPNTGIPVTMGTTLFLTSDSGENIDYKGLAPDIWCDPTTSIDAVLEMMRYYDLADDATVAALEEKEASRPDVLTLEIWGSQVYDGGVFGGSDMGTYQVPVYINGVPTEAFTVEGGAEWVSVNKVDGVIEFDNLQVETGNTCPITVTAGNNSATFLWFAG